jgi:hypothetical protein
MKAHFAGHASFSAAEMEQTNQMAVAFLVYINCTKSSKDCPALSLNLFLCLSLFTQN